MRSRRRPANEKVGFFPSRRTTWWTLRVAGIALLLLIGCGESRSTFPALGDPRDDLVGCYSTRPGGDAEIRVREHEGNYLLSVASDWADEVVAAEPTPNEVKELFQDQAHLYVSGLHSGMLGLFEVRPGMRINSDTVKGKHVVVIPFGAGEAYATDCPR